MAIPTCEIAGVAMTTLVTAGFRRAGTQSATASTLKAAVICSRVAWRLSQAITPTRPVLRKVRTWRSPMEPQPMTRVRGLEDNMEQEKMSQRLDPAASGSLIK